MGSLCRASFPDASVALNVVPSRLHHLESDRGAHSWSALPLLVGDRGLRVSGSGVLSRMSPILRDSRLWVTLELSDIGPLSAPSPGLLLVGFIKKLCEITYFSRHKS